MKFDNTGIEEYEFHQHKSSISINNVDIDVIVVSYKLTFGKQHNKYFIGYKDNKKLDLYAYSFCQCIYIKNIFIFLTKDKKFFNKL